MFSAPIVLAMLFILIVAGVVLWVAYESRKEDEVSVQSEQVRTRVSPGR